MTAPKLTSLSPRIEKARFLNLAVNGGRAGDVPIGKLSCGFKKRCNFNKIGVLRP
jgi:hypothetical protein